MPRPKEFDRETALREAIQVFCDGGFEGTSTDDLLRGMGISRQSMYDTFGDKRALYLEALRHYITERVANQIRILSAAASALKGLEATLNAAAIAGTKEGSSGCMGLGAISEFGRSDHEIASLIDTAERTLQSALLHRIDEGKSRGEISADVDTRAATDFLRATFSAIKLAARGGASPQNLRNIARMAIRSLK
jgi:TetR/AcrR family transcriptional regulator, transcriptional repressor for nem operon